MSGYIGNIPVPQATQTRDNFTATASQTTFATSGYTPGYLDVYLNGVHLDPTDYTATNGTDVVLATGATAGDVVSIVAFTTFEISSDTFANAVTFNDGITVDNDGATVATFDRATDNGTIVELQKDGTAVGSIGVESNDNFFIEASTTDHAGLTMWSGASSGKGRITPRLNGTSSDASVDLGRATNRFQDLYLSGGVYLGGTGAANYLADYEEGTWTPVTSQGSATTSGFYRKIGNFVSVCCVLSDVNNNTSTTDIAITGLPFTSANNDAISLASCLIRYFTPSTTPMQVIGYVSGNSSEIRPYKMFAGGANWDRIPYTDFSRADWDAQFFISYYTDS